MLTPSEPLPCFWPAGSVCAQILLCAVLGKHM